MLVCCHQGRFANVTGLPDCLPCPSGTFRGTTNPTMCQPCGPGFDCSSEGLVSAPPCSAGSFCPNATTNLTCPPGFYCPGGSAQPVNCSAGDNCSQPGLLLPKSCAVGFYCSSPASRPLPCPIGSYCPQVRYLYATVSPCFAMDHAARAGFHPSYELSDDAVLPQPQSALCVPKWLCVSWQHLCTQGLRSRLLLPYHRLCRGTKVRSGVLLSQRHVATFLR